MDRIQFIASLRSLINYHRICGLKGYHLEKDIQKKIEAMETMLISSPEVESDTLPVRQKNEAQKIQVEEKKLVTGLNEIPAMNSNIGSCSKCSLHQSRQVSTAGKGGNTPLLLIVGDWLTVSNGFVPVTGDLFGRAQDSMLAKMIAAINLTEEDVFITNVIKCSLPDTCQPTLEHITMCGHFLTNQIELLSPRIICSMGIIASRLLTGRSQPLSQQRGHFVSYKTVSGREIPLIPTYHPTFLLQNPEMKQAAWSDLQEIEKKIREIRL